jgi:hypothetical protein
MVDRRWQAREDKLNGDASGAVFRVDALHDIFVLLAWRAAQLVVLCLIDACSVVWARGWVDAAILNCVNCVHAAFVAGWTCEWEVLWEDCVSETRQDDK